LGVPDAARLVDQAANHARDVERAELIPRDRAPVGDDWGERVEDLLAQRVLLRQVHAAQRRTRRDPQSAVPAKAVACMRGVGEAAGPGDEQ